MWRLMLVGIGIGVFLCLLFTIALDTHKSHVIGRIERGVEDDLGFRLGTPYQDGREIITLREVTPGKPMAKAGLQSGDVLLIPAYNDTRDLSRT